MSTTLQRTATANYGAVAPSDGTTKRQLYEGGGTATQRLQVVLWIGIAAVGLILWTVLEQDDRSVIATLLALIGVSTVAWSIGLWSSGRSDDTHLNRLDLYSLVGIGALAAAAVFTGTITSPFILLIPLGVGLLSARNTIASFAIAGGALGFAGLLGVGVRMFISSDSIESASVLFLSSLGLMTLFAYFAAPRLNAASKVITTSRARSDSQSGLNRDQIERLDAANSPVAVARVAADILHETAKPTYLAIVEQIPDTKILRPLVERGTIEIDVERLRTGLATLSHESVSATEARVLLNDGSNLDSVVCRRLGVDAVLIVPLRRMGAGIGAIHMAWSELKTQNQLEVARDLAMSVSHWITPDIAISRVASELERGYVNAIAGVCSSLDERTEFTSGHSRRVARIALEIAELLPLSDHDQRQLVYAAEMHDLGWVGVDHELLTKPAALNDEEWTRVQTIPGRGAGIVDTVSYFGEVSDAIRYVRERWDGQGYPRGLEGEQIPLLARVIAIAEAYDSMTSPRPYREAMTSNEALRQLWRERGGKFDPQIVETFVMHRAPVSSSLNEASRTSN